ncbi:spore coat protein GerQ [Brevibacillus humidisoli]|uniref:spore coat protein GerQ n=1 Tax=Brevibacillus humidisoli TaxID=2895522 RepID=UPI001E363757|nr:spore coat protein GerQ [Brevibacillus humidisoli]UFJ39233.1 spore coat protein GerQ [Brevibacillus humidisoli]
MYCNPNQGFPGYQAYQGYQGYAMPNQPYQGLSLPNQTYQGLATPNQPYQGLATPNQPFYYDPGQMVSPQMETQKLTPQAIPMLPPSGAPIPGTRDFVEQSYVENILRLNRGKMATVYMTFENNTEWNAKVFRGIIEAAGRDHLIISDPDTGIRYLLLMVNLDYITFDEPIEYVAPPIPGEF